MSAEQMSVTARGIWWLSSKTQPKATRAMDGTFTLMLFCFDRQGPHMVEPWRVIWSGPDACNYWQHFAHLFQPGVGLLMHLEQLRIFSVSGKYSGAEFHANVKSLQVIINGYNGTQDHTTNQAVAHAS